jgi:sec-independent protein translocase protein TatA
MMSLALFNNIGPMELIIILTIALLVFGSRLPEVGRSLGKGITEFRKGMKGIEDEVDHAMREPPKSAELPPYSATPAPPPVERR